MCIILHIIYGFAVFIVVVFSCLYIYLKYVFGYWTRKGVKYVETPTIPFGNLWTFMKNERSINLQFYEFYKKTQGQYGGLILLNQPALIIKDPEIIRHILVKDFNHFCDRGFYVDVEKEPLSGHLFRLNGQHWRNMRSKLNQAFTPTRIKLMFNYLVKSAKNQEEYLDTYECDSEINVSESSVKYTADCIASSMFGIDVNSFSDPKNVFWSKIISTVFALSISRYITFLFIQFIPDIIKKLNINTIYKKSADQVLELVQEVIDYREKNNCSRDDFMQIMIQLKNKETTKFVNGKFVSDKLNIMEITSSVYSMFFAGFETSASTISYCLYHLAFNQEIQLRVQNEIDSVLEKHKGAITYESLMDMKYLDCVIKEVLRLYPVLGYIQRRVVNDYQLPNSSLTLEKGTMIVISLFGLHHDSENFPNPEKFDPDRFLPENYTSIRNFTYLPFGEGLRVCIGKKFGILMTTMGVVNFLKKNSFHVCGKTETDLKFQRRFISHTPINPIFLRMKRR